MTQRGGCGGGRDVARGGRREQEEKGLVSETKPDVSVWAASGNRATQNAVAQWPCSDITPPLRTRRLGEVVFGWELRNQEAE